MKAQTHPDAVVNHALTKREFFAALILHGICADPSLRLASPKDAADLAVQAADQLIERLNKYPP